MGKPVCLNLICISLCQMFWKVIRSHCTYSSRSPLANNAHSSTTTKNHSKSIFKKLAFMHVVLMGCASGCNCCTKLKFVAGQKMWGATEMILVPIHYSATRESRFQDRRAVGLSCDLFTPSRSCKLHLRPQFQWNCQKPVPGCHHYRSSPCRWGRRIESGLLG